MTITSIKIKNRFGNTILSIKKSAVFKTSSWSSVQCYKSPVTEKIDLYKRGKGNALTDAYNEFMHDWELGRYRYVSKINSTGKSDANGLMVLNTDRCMSWTATGTGLQFTGYKTNTIWGFYLTSSISSIGNNLVLWDTCGSCPNSCERAIKVRRMFENLKIQVNTLKDASINLSDSYGSVDRFGALTERNLQVMLGARTPVPAECNVPEEIPWWLNKYALDSNYNEYRDHICTGNFGFRNCSMLSKFSFPDTIGLYVSTIHFWNYLMATRNINIVITPDKQIIGAFSIQTKTNYYAAGGDWKIYYNIDIDLYSSYPLTSFRNSVFIQPHVLIGTVNGASQQEYYNTIEVIEDPLVATHKTIEGWYQQNSVSTVFGVKVDVYPFKACSVYNSTTMQERTVDDATALPTYHIREDGSIGVEVGTNLTTFTLTKPTFQDWEASQRFMMQVNNTYNVWKVRITWIITNTSTNEENIVTETRFLRIRDSQNPATNLWPDRQIKEIKTFNI